MMSRNSPRLWGVAKACCLSALLLLSTLRATATEAPTATESITRTTSPPNSSGVPPEGPAKTSYIGGQLTIRALNATLAQVLANVAALTGVQIDVPEGANNRVIPSVQLGPGPAQQILASFLSDAQFDYIIQASDSDPDKLESVLIMPRKKRAGEGTGIETTARPYARNTSPPAQSEDAPMPTISVSPLPVNAAAEASTSSLPISSTQPEQSAVLPLPERAQSSLVRTTAPTAPQTPIAQSANQQLQQMYQQRMQMIQQDRQTVAPPSVQR